MDTSRERDQSIERLLRQSLKAPRHAGVTDSCLDAETLAAWVDGGLSGAALEMAQSHVADCARCQSLVGAMARTNAVVPQPEPERAARRWLAWLVPLTAAAAAVALWVAVPREETSLPLPLRRRRGSPGQTARNGAPIARGPREQLQEGASRAEPASPATSQKPAAPLRRRSCARTRRLEADSSGDGMVASAPAAAPPAPPPRRDRSPAQAPAARARAANAFAPTCGPGWERRAHRRRGATHGRRRAINVGVLAGRSRRRGHRLDRRGRTWRRVAFPEITDLSAVRATDARTASVIDRRRPDFQHIRRRRHLGS